MEALTQREASLAEEVVRERMAKQEKAEQLKELHREMPSGEIHQQVATLREACADAKGELAALKVQLGAAKQQAAAAQQREAEHGAALRRAEAHAAELEHPNPNPNPQA